MFNTYPKATFEVVHSIPRAKFEMIEKDDQVYGEKNKIDYANKALRIK